MKKEVDQRLCMPLRVQIRIFPDLCCIYFVVPSPTCSPKKKDTEDGRRVDEERKDQREKIRRRGVEQDKDNTSDNNKIHQSQSRDLTVV